MVFKIALLIALERRKGFLFLVGKYFEVVLIYKNDFQEIKTILYIRMTKGKWGILIDIGLKIFYFCFKLTCKTYIHTIAIYRIGMEA